jgi:hypothetical protein
MRTVFHYIAASVISLVWIGIVLFISIGWIGFAGNTGGYLAFIFGIGIYFLKLFVFYSAVTLVPLSLFVGWHTAKKFLLRYGIWWFLVFVLWILVYAIPFSDIAALKVPIPKGATQVQYFHGESGIMHRGSIGVEFVWSGSEEEFFNFYNSYYEKKGYTNTFTSTDTLKMGCGDEVINQNSMRIEKKENTVRAFVNVYSFDCFLKLWR